MVRRMMIALGLISLLNVGESLAMENPNSPNPNTVNRIAEIIQNYGFQENTPETKDIILDALQGVRATDEEIREAFKKVESEGNQGPQKQKPRELTPTEKENAYKMWLMKQALEKGTLPEVPRDVQNVIGGTLHDVSANPVLDGTLEYTMDNGEKKPFKIKDLVKKDGSIDLSNPIFGDSSEDLLITTDPEKFFNIDENSRRLIILIAPRFLIEEKIGSSAKTLEPIMAKWNDADAPIGIFYRMDYWTNRSSYYYLTSEDLFKISKNNLYDSWAEIAVKSPHGDRQDYLRVMQYFPAYICKKFHVHF